MRVTRYPHYIFVFKEKGCLPRLTNNLFDVVDTN